RSGQRTRRGAAIVARRRAGSPRSCRHHPRQLPAEGAAGVVNQLAARAVNAVHDVVWLRVEIVGHHLWHALIAKIRPVERLRVVRGEKTVATSTDTKI